MKLLLFLSFVVSVPMITLYAQNNVGIGTTSPHPNASLDIKGTNKGLLIPRGDAATRNALNANTAKGLLMYDTTSNLVWMHIGNGLASGWKSLSVGTNYWTQNGALGTEIANTNTGGFWSANPTTVLSDPGLILPPVSGPGTRLMWIPQKSAFRVGSTDASHWDAPSIGLFSFANGLNTIASGSYAIALGTASKATAITSTAWGWFTHASGDISTSLGYKTRSKPYASVVIGRWNDSIAISNNSTWINSDPLFMIGNGASEAARHNAMVVYKNGNMVLKNPNAFYYSKLPANYAMPVNGEGTRMMWLPEISAFRVGTVSDTAWDTGNIGVGSIALGLDCMASGEGALALGTSTIASGAYATALGGGTRARGYTSTVLGMFNEPIVAAPEYAVDPITPLFIIGNGNNQSDRKNAMVVRKDGHVGIGGNAPKTFLHVDVGTSLAEGFLVSGDNYNTSATVPNLGDGSRMMFYPNKCAFRVGVIEGGPYWDNVNVGQRSVAMGFNTTASGYGSTSLGAWSQATGPTSIAMGNGPIASGESSIAFGWYAQATGLISMATGEQTRAQGVHSTAMGHSTIAGGQNAVAMGLSTKAKGFSSLVVGMFNDSLMASNQTVVDPLTPLFIVGNGDGNAAGQRRNAMVVRKDGRVGVGTNTPVARLTAVGTAGNPTIPGTTSTGIFRIGLNDGEGIDMGKMNVSPFSGWIQAGIDGTLADPLSLQPAGGKVGIGTTNPAASAVLEVSSTSKGFLPPRMTYANRVGISSPTAGLMIWCTNCGANGQLQIYNGSFWTSMAGTPAVGVPVIGMHDAGGVIAYIFQVGDPGYVAGETHGLVATLIDVTTSTTWGCSGTNLPGAAGTVLGTGPQNTTDIVNGCGSAGIAARICDNLFEGGYVDWYLPSKDELNKLYLNQAAIGGFGADFYWSSSESSTTQSWCQDFSVGTQALQTKTFSFRVRAVRTF